MVNVILKFVGSACEDEMIARLKATVKSRFLILILVLRSAIGV